MPDMDWLALCGAPRLCVGRASAEQSPISLVRRRIRIEGIAAIDLPGKVAEGQPLLVIATGAAVPKADGWHSHQTLIGFWPWQQRLVCDFIRQVCPSGIAFQQLAEFLGWHRPTEIVSLTLGTAVRC